MIRTWLVRWRRAWVHRHCHPDLPMWTAELGGWRLVMRRHNWEWCEMFGRVAQDRARAAAAPPPRRVWRWVKRNAWFPVFVAFLALMAHLLKVKFW